MTRLLSDAEIAEIIKRAARNGTTGGDWRAADNDRDRLLADRAMLMAVAKAAVKDREVVPTRGINVELVSKIQHEGWRHLDLEGRCVLCDALRAAGLIGDENDPV